MTLIVLQCHSSVKQVSLKMLCIYLIKLKLCTLVDDVKEVMNISLFFYFPTCSRKTVDISFLEKNPLILPFSRSPKVRSIKLCSVKTFLRVYLFIEGLMTLTLFQGHRCVRSIFKKNANCGF